MSIEVSLLTDSFNWCERPPFSMSTATLIGECSTINADIGLPDAILEHGQALSQGKWNLDTIQVSRRHAHGDLSACRIERDLGPLRRIGWASVHRRPRLRL
jgi:hypothetical protein